VTLAPVAEPPTEPAGAAGRAREAAPRATTVSQVALVREAAEHPLVARARTVFDAAIRRVEPPRRRADAPEADAPVPTPAAAGSAAAGAEDEYAAAASREDD